MARLLLPFFETENRLYANATVTVYTVSGGAITSTEATLYADRTSSSVLANPQKLSGTGRWKQPVYVAEDVILSIAAINAASHNTGIFGVTDDPSSELTVASDAITITSNDRVVHHTVDTEGDASSDNLDTINGGDHVGQVLILQAADSTRTVSVIQGGNIELTNNHNLDHADDTIMLVWDGSNWCEIAFGQNSS